MKDCIDNITAILKVAPAEMQALCDRLPPEPRRQYRDSCEAAIQALAWRHAYLSARYGDGCGDQGHDDAVKAANKLLKKIRKAMGFTYPERGAIHV